VSAGDGVMKKTHSGGAIIPVRASRTRGARGSRPAGGRGATRLQILPPLEVGDHVADETSVLADNL
jgi:hypothetical protein